MNTATDVTEERFSFTFPLTFPKRRTLSFLGFILLSLMLYGQAEWFVEEVSAFWKIPVNERVFQDTGAIWILSVSYLLLFVLSCLFTSGIKKTPLKGLGEDGLVDHFAYGLLYIPFPGALLLSLFDLLTGSSIGFVGAFVGGFLSGLLGGLFISFFLGIRNEFK